MYLPALGWSLIDCFAATYRKQHPSVLDDIHVRTKLHKVYLSYSTISNRIMKTFQFWACYVDCKGQYKDAVRMTLDQLDVIKKFVRKYPDIFRYETTAQGICAS